MSLDEGISAQPVLVHGSTQFDLASEISGHTYRIFVFKPDAPPPPEGYPLFLVTDANLTFPIAATLAIAHMFTGGAAPLVVGVGYPADNPATPFLLRNRDLTPPTPLSAIKPNPLVPQPKAEDYGGSDAFRRFLVEELRPLIAKSYPVDSAHTALYGHSLGGLFALEVLFRHPASFRTYVASSPSIWWNGRALLEEEPAFVKRVRAGESAPRVLVLVGAKEQEIPDTPVPGMTPEQVEELMREARMVDNARELAARLAAVSGNDGYRAEFHAFDGEEHMSVIAASISRGLTFALRK
jgi:predicted alpha/beta superfamily hydrolase